MESNVEKQIVQAAKKVFLAHGYNETNMAMIAQEAGLARPAMYYYFRSKERIFEAVFDDIIHDFFPSVMGILQQDIPMGERLAQLVDTYVEQLKRNPQLPLFVVKEINRDPQRIVRTVTEHATYRLPQAFLTFYREAVAKGELKACPLFAVPFTLVGQLVTPFLARPLVSTVSDTPFEEVLDAWKPFVVENLCRLLLP